MIALRAIVLYVWMLSCLIVGKSAKGEAAYMFQDVLGQGEPIQPRVNRHEGYNTESEGNTVHIFFGSCNSHIRDQSIWNVIKRKVLDEYPGSLWVWLGDVIYADNFDSTRLRFRSNSRNEVQQRYDIQRRSTNYAAIADVVPILGIWDDHDYGINDGDRDFPDKFQMQQVFLDFLDVPSSAPIRSQLGLYSYQRILSPKGDRTVLIILLDNRFHKTPYGTDEEEGDFLGEEQWLWLQETLRNVPSDVTLIGSGIQVLASTKPVEDWSRFPNSYRRLLALLAETERPGVVFLSGDIHIAELHRDPCPSPVAYPLYDLTSSGLTHAVPTFVKHLIEFFLYTSTLKQSHYGKNFGHVAIDFERESIELMAYDVIGNTRIHHTVPFSEIHIPMTQGKQRAQHTCPARIVSPLALVMRSVVRFLERISLRAGIAPSGFHLSLLFLLCIIVTAIYFIFLALRKCAAFMCNRNRSDLKKMK